MPLPSNVKLLRLKSTKPPHLKPKVLPRTPFSSKFPAIQPRTPGSAPAPSPALGTSRDEQIVELEKRIALLEAEAENRREFDEDVLQNLTYALEVALTTEHYFSVQGAQLTIKTGDASIVLKPNGDITVRGKRIDIKGSGEVEIKGSKVIQN